MQIVITGGAGFLGARLARALLARGTLTDAAGTAQRIERIRLVDQALARPAPTDSRIESVAGDIADPAFVELAIPRETDAIFHFAAVVSGGAEADFDLGMRVNLDGGRAVLERARRCERPPRIVFTSSVAAFGGDLPGILDDETPLRPQSSYGVQKVICEYLLGDYTRKGFIDGRALRLPTIVVRPGKANRALSSYASGIIREPLAGIDATCPVTPQTAMWLLSPGRAVEALLHALELPAAAWGHNRALNLPGITATAAEMVDSLRRVAGDRVANRVLWQPDPRVQAVVGTWPARFRTPRARALGFAGDRAMDDIIRDYIADQQLLVH